jgi:hypothetical protein
MRATGAPNMITTCLSAGTGANRLATTPEAKRLGLLHQFVPGAGIVGMLIDPNFQEAADKERKLRGASPTIGQRMRTFKQRFRGGVSSCWRDSLVDQPSPPHQ